MRLNSLLWGECFEKLLRGPAFAINSTPVRDKPLRLNLTTKASPRSGYNSEHIYFQNQQSGRHCYAERSSGPLFALKIGVASE